ncbi:MAG: C40 family peptidase [Bacteroidia bacterium]
MKRLTIFFFLVVIGVQHPLVAQVDSLKKVGVNGDSIVNYAMQFLGTPYKYACASPAGFDCSGFTNYVFAHFGIDVPRSSSAYLNFGKDISLSEARKGDVIVFRGTRREEERAGHVGIVISNPGEPLRFIHASSSKKHPGVVITDYETSAYPQRFIRICRVF